MSIVLSRQTAEYPQHLHHKDEPPRLVTTKEEEAKLARDGWSRSYIHHDFPKTKYHATLPPKHVETAEDEQALGSGWYDKPGDVPEAAADPQAEINALKARLFELDPGSLKQGRPRKDE